MNLSKEDLKLLGLLPKMLQTLRKVSAMSQELQQLGTAFGGAQRVTPPESATWEHPSSHPLPEPKPRSRHSANLLTSNPDRFHAVQQDSERAQEQRDYLASLKNGAERASFMEQFEGDGEETQE